MIKVKYLQKVIVSICLFLALLLLFYTFSGKGKQQIVNVQNPQPELSPYPISKENIVMIPPATTKQALPESWWGGSGSRQLLFAISGKGGGIIQVLPDGKVNVISKQKVLSYSYNAPVVSYVVAGGVVHLYDVLSKNDTVLPSFDKIRSLCSLPFILAALKPLPNSMPLMAGMAKAA